MTLKFQKLIYGVVLFLLLSALTSYAQNSPEHDAILSVERIWDRAGHNAFTSFVEFNGALYVAFRESTGHVSDINGSIRVIASDDDGQNWQSVAHVRELGLDLRDPQLSVTPDKRIMLNIGGSLYNAGKLQSMTPKVSFSDHAGKNFSPIQNVSLDSKIKTGTDWLWRATWHNGKAYAGVYQPSKEKSVQLVVSEDGITYRYITTFEVNEGNETTLRFQKNNDMVAVVRRGGKNNGAIGTSPPPYTDWQWNALDRRLGGPDLIILDEGPMLCATREYLPSQEHTIITRVDLNGTTKKLLTLPSSGDCSYPGLLMKNNTLFMSYYSSHEEKTAIYLARIALVKSVFEGE